MNDAGEAAQVYEPLADGVYDMVIVNAEHKRSATGKDGYNVTAEVESGPNKGRKVFNTFWVSPDSPIAMGIFFRQFGALGLDKAFFDREPSDDDIVAALKGKRMRAQVVTGTFNDKKRNEIKNVERPVGPPPASIGGLPSAAPVAVSKPAPTPTTPAAPANDPWANTVASSGPAWGAPAATEQPGPALAPPPVPSLGSTAQPEPPF